MDLGAAWDGVPGSRRRATIRYDSLRLTWLPLEGVTVGGRKLSDQEQIQFFFDDNKRTSRFMMNGVLMTEGIDAISIPAVRAIEFNSRMVDFYISRDASPMMAFVLDCHPQIARIHQLNPGLSVIKDAPRINYFRLEDSTASQTNAHRSSNDIPRSSELLPSMDELQRNAAENWRRHYHSKGPDLATQEPVQTKAKEITLDSDLTQHERDAGADCESEHQE